MKTNFLSRNTLPRGSGKLLEFGLMFMVLICFGLSSYAQTPSDLGQQQHLYLKLHNDNPTIQDCIKLKPASDEVAKPFSYSYYSYANSEEATLRLFEGSDVVAPDDGVSFHAQLTLMDNVPSLFIRFGVSMDNFKRTYSLNSYHSNPNLNNIPRLYYDKGHVEVSQGGIIDIYYDGNSYQVHYDNIPVECAEIGALSGLRESFVSTYGRLNTGGEVNFMLEPYVETLETCEVGCFHFYDPDLFQGKPTPCVPQYLDIACGDGENKEETAQINDFAVYPNPVSDLLTIELNPLKDEVIRVNIVDATGRLMSYQEQEVTTNTTSIIHLDTKKLVVGMYYIKIDSAYKFETKKINVLR